MPRSLKRLLSISGVLLVLIIVVIAAKTYLNKQPFVRNRELSSTEASRKNKLKMSLTSGKHYAALSAKIDEPQFIPDKPEDSVSLVGHFVSHQELSSSLHYTWILPKGLELIGGNLQGEISSVRPNEIVSVQILIKGFSKEQLSHITLLVEAYEGSEKVVSTAVMSSRPEESNESRAAEMQESAKKFEEENY